MNMDCEFSDAQLLTYLDGEVDAETAARIESSMPCRERIQQLDRLQTHMTAQLYRLTCPRPEELGEYHLNMLSKEQTRAIRQHLSTCPHCTREVAQLRSYLDALAPELELSVAERIRVLIAKLMPTGLPGGQIALVPAFSLRGDEKGLYQYEAGEYQVMVEVQDDAEEAGRKALLGLVIGPDIQQFRVYLLQDGRLITTADGDDLGNFFFSDLGPGIYELIINNSDLEVHIQALEI